MRKNSFKKGLLTGMSGMMAAMMIMTGCGSGDTEKTESSTEAIATEADTTSENKVESTEGNTEEVNTTVEDTTEEVTEEPEPETETETETEEEAMVDDGVWKNNADISWIDPEAKLVALTFDDGPVGIADTASSIRIQNALAENGMHATFFYWGNSMSETNQQEIARAYELGFEVGNHTWSHPYLSNLTEEEIVSEVERIDEILQKITGQEKFLVRPPYLSVNQLVKDTVDVPLINCGLDSQDWNNATTEEIIERIKTAVENDTLDGKIVLMHETYKTTAEAVEYLIPYLKEQGYQVVTVSELFLMRGQEMTAGNVYTQCNK